MDVEGHPEVDGVCVIRNLKPPISRYNPQRARVPSLHAAWLFNENGGTQANDSSGRGLNATFTTAPAWGTGPFGPELVFTAASSQYLTVSAIRKVVWPITICLLAKVTSGGGSVKTFFDHSTGGNDGLRLKVHGVRWWSTLGGVQDFDTGLDFTDGDYSFGAVSLNGDGGSGQAWVRNASGAWSTATPITLGTMDGTPTQFWIGRSFAAGQYMGGNLVYLQVFDRALSFSEVQDVEAHPYVAFRSSVLSMFPGSSAAPAGVTIGRLRSNAGLGLVGAGPFAHANAGVGTI